MVKVKWGWNGTNCERKGEQSVAGVTNQDAEFSKIRVYIVKELACGFLGNNQWRVSVGGFLRKKRLYFPDYFHFKATPTISRPNQFDAFFLTDFYQFSTPSTYLEAHFEQELGGFLFDKIPGYRLLGLREFVGVHYLKQQSMDSYMELNVGVEKILFKVFGLRIDLFVPLIGGRPGQLAVKYIPPGPLIKVTE